MSDKGETKKITILMTKEMELSREGAGLGTEGKVCFKHIKVSMMADMVMEMTCSK